MTQHTTAIKRALISVSDKTNLDLLIKGLSQLGVEIFSTGGTAKAIQQAGVAVTEISQYTEFPEMMGGRLKTLHPRVHGALLSRAGIDDDAVQQQGIKNIDLLVVNLYPFEQTIAQDGVQLEQAIENIDIGGPAMIRAAAKNHQRVTVVVNPDDYQALLNELENNAGVAAKRRYQLAVKAFAHTARYDGLIANYLSENDAAEAQDFPQYLNLQFKLSQPLRYGENPHQKAAFYTEKEPLTGTLGGSQQLQGKALSYNNIADADAALSCVKEFSQPTCVIVKHANPCGVAIEQDLTQAYLKAFATDATSAFGGVLAFNGTVDETTAQTIIDKQFAEVIIAPAFSEQAIKVFAAKKNLRLINSGQWTKPTEPWQMYKRVSGGLLVQDADTQQLPDKQLQVVSQRIPSEAEMRDLQFAWKVAKWVKSNAIVYAKDLQTIGVGAGQMSRVVSARIAGIKAQDAELEVAGSVMASDAFFPFRDGIDAAAKAGIKAVIQPGGSIRDEEVIQAADEHQMAMVFTGMRHFNH